MAFSSRSGSFGKPTARVLSAIVFGLAVVGWAGEAVVTLAWDASRCGCAAGYRVYYGTNARSYPFVTNAGLALTQTVVLPRGGRWFFAATTVSTNGLESDFSNEVSWESRPAAPVMLSESWVRVVPLLERSTNGVSWEGVTGAPSWFPATNRMEFFRGRRLMIEPERRPIAP